jgi:hypothetical protein
LKELHDELGKKVLKSLANVDKRDRIACIG